MKLSQLIKQKSFASASVEAVLSVVVTSNWLMSEIGAFMAPFGVTPAQYNVLRILRGSHPKPLTCSEIGERLLDRTPDVTRLLTRLERQAYVTRVRSEVDRRVIYVSVTPQGIRLLGEMQQTVDTRTEALAQRLSEEDKRRLIALLEAMRTDQLA